MSEFDIAIIGAGPSGISAAVNAAVHNLSHILIEKSEVGNTVFQYQLGKYVMAEPQKLPQRGKVPFVAGAREEVLSGWENILKEAGVNLVRGEVRELKPCANGFEVMLGDQKIVAKKVVLSVGVQGSPRKVGVDGQDLPHVTYTLSDPAAFNGRDILVIGAGDAAIENALALMDNNNVSVLNRTDDFPRAKEANASKIMSAINSGKIRHISNAEILRIEPEIAHIQTPQGEIALKCNHIIARIGCIMPRKFLEGLGIKFPNSDPQAVPVVSSSYESNVPGLYLLGALIGYPLIKQCINQGYEVVEHIVGNPVEPADQGLLAEALAPIGSDTNKIFSEIKDTLPLFKELSDSQYRELIIESKTHVLNPGDIVFNINDYTDTFFSVVAGSVEVLIPNSQKTIRIDKGNFFGELGLLSGRRRSATVRAAERCILIESPRKQIIKLNNSVEALKQKLDQSFIRRALATTIFPQVDQLFLEELANKAKLKNLRKGDILFKEGEQGDACYVVRKGSVKVSKLNREGKEVTQTYIPAGNIVGEMALVEDKPRSATVSAAVPCELILIEKADFVELINKDPKAREIVTALAESRKVQNITAAQNEYTGGLLDFMMAQGVTDADNFLLIDSDLCVGCDNCEKACAATHGGFSRLDRKGGKTFANIQVPVSCRHCENPLCMLDCPPDALTRKPNGEVVIRDSCIGCGNCVGNCPYGVIQLSYAKQESSFSLMSLFGKPAKKKEKGPAKAAKCDLCEKLDSGPACVRSCPTGAAIRVNPRQMLSIIGQKRAAS